VKATVGLAGGSSLCQNIPVGPFTVGAADKPVSNGTGGVTVSCSVELAPCCGQTFDFSAQVSSAEGDVTLSGVIAPGSSSSGAGNRAMLSVGNLTYSGSNCVIMMSTGATAQPGRASLIVTCNMMVVNGNRENVCAGTFVVDVANCVAAP
jgi:hypothetical protein